MTITIYGIKSCSTMKKAFTKLDELTWRKLEDAQKQAADSDVDKSIDLLIENTSMIKRPIVEGELTDKNKPILLCGFDEAEFDKVFS